MKRIIIGAMLFVLYFTLPVFGQISNFNLSDYKLPDLKRHALEVNYYFSAYNNLYNYPDSYNYDKKSNNQYSGDIQIRYDYFLNTPSKQKETLAILAFSSYYNNRKEDEQLDSKQSLFTPQIYYNSINRKYYKENHFLEVDLVLDYLYHYNKYSGVSSNTTKEHNLSGLLPLKIGIGRIEPIQDVRQALYILDELKKRNRITTDMSDEEIIKFAELISKLKNKRFFDSRIRRIAELESIDSFLVANNYVNNSDMRYFTTLSDYWSYGDRPLRNSGSRVSAAIYPGYYLFDKKYSSSTYSTDQLSSLSAFTMNGGIEYKREKPINLYWQNTIDLTALGGIIEGKNTEINSSTSSTLRVPNLQLGFSQQIGYYPNTRTDIEFDYTLQYIQFFDKSDMVNNIIGVESKALKIAASLSANYYISPKFRLNISSSIFYILQDIEDDVLIRNFNTLYNPNLIYHFDPNSYSLSYQKTFSNQIIIRLLYSIF